MECVRTNLLGAASTQYWNCEFSSMVNFGGKQLGIKEGGLYQLCCDNKDTSGPINAYFTLGSTDLGAQQLKRMRKMYIGLECTGNMQIEITVDDVIVAKYTVSKVKASGQQRIRVPISSRGLQGRYWKIKISNVGGCDFAVDSIKALIYLRPSGIG